MKNFIANVLGIAFRILKTVLDIMAVVPLMILMTIIEIVVTIMHYVHYFAAKFYVWVLKIISGELSDIDIAVGQMMLKYAVSYMSLAVLFRYEVPEITNSSEDEGD